MPSSSGPGSVSAALKPAQSPNRSFATLRTIMALVLREMSSRYGRTPGGYIWAVLEPMGMIMILALGFSLLLRTPSLGNSFILFYATGFLPFNLYQSVSLMVSRALSFSRALLFYPSVTWLDAIIARFLLNTLTSAMVAYLLLTLIINLTETNVVLEVPPIVWAMALAAFLGLGVGTLNCLLSGLFPTWEMIWSIVTRPLFLASGVIFIYEDMPPLAQEILWYNPLMHITGYIRMGFYPSYHPDYLSLPYVVAISLICLTLGLILLRRYHKTILNM